MNIGLVSLLVLGLFAPPAASTQQFSAFADGETYIYRVSWGVFSRAGEIKISATEDVLDGRPIMRITTRTSSRGMVRSLYRYDDEGEVVIDIASNRLLFVVEQGEDSKRRTESRTDFDYEAGIARHRDKHRPHRDTDLPIPEGKPIDLISALVAPRDWNMAPGDTRKVLVHAGRYFLPITLHAEEVEEISAPIGRFSALRMVPRMEKEEAKGVFEKEGEIQVWISQDKKRLPVRMQLKLKYGTATLLLQEHIPGK